MTRRHPANALAAAFQLIVRYYPWSVLWILLAMAVTLVVTASWLPCLIILTLIGALVFQWLHRQHDEHRGGI